MIDVKRTNPSEVFGLKRVNDMLTRALFIWTFKHPASGYVQGINDLGATLLHVFLTEAVQPEEGQAPLTVEAFEGLSEETALEIESDTYWCLENFSENIQANYTDGQPGVYKILGMVTKLVSKKDEALIDLLAEAEFGIEKFVYRWINCILVREFSMDQITRIWDTLLSEELDISTALGYLCAAMLLTLSPDIKSFSD